jgi:hypothetical protein
MKAPAILLSVFVLAPVSGLASAAAHAQAFEVKPGLWEHSIDLKSASGRIELALEIARTQMQLLPPAQRKAIEDTLAQQGLKADFVNQTFQNCITEEEATSGEFSFAEDGGCEQTDVRNEGTTTHISFVCAQGQGELQLIDGSAYTGSSSMTLNFAGVLEDATATHSGRWLGASCAALAPQ